MQEVGFEQAEVWRPGEDILLGLDHTRLTYPFGGREMRLTDVHGVVVQGILA